MKRIRTAMILVSVMFLASIGGVALRPTANKTSKRSAMSLEAIVPTQFADWKEIRGRGIQVVNPQTKELLEKLYSQVLTRTYVNTAGYEIMLSLAYGDDQRGGLQAHRPEVCYPAQGFKLHAIEDGQLPTAYGSIDVRRLNTSLGQRNEPITYWLTVGDRVIKSALDKRIEEIRLGLSGQIPDGLIFRVSSIDTDAGKAFAVQQQFAAAMMAAVPNDTRRRLSGLEAPRNPGN